MLRQRKRCMKKLAVLVVGLVIGSGQLRGDQTQEFLNAFYANNFTQACAIARENDLSMSDGKKAMIQELSWKKIQSKTEILALLKLYKSVAGNAQNVGASNGIVHGSVEHSNATVTWNEESMVWLRIQRVLTGSVAVVAALVSLVTTGFGVAMIASAQKDDPEALTIPLAVTGVGVASGILSLVCGIGCARLWWRISSIQALEEDIKALEEIVVILS